MDGKLIIEQWSGNTFVEFIIRKCFFNFTHPEVDQFNKRNRKTIHKYEVRYILPMLCQQRQSLGGSRGCIPLSVSLMLEGWKQKSIVGLTYWKFEPLKMEIFPFRGCPKNFAPIRVDPTIRLSIWSIMWLMHPLCLTMMWDYLLFD